MNLMGFFNKNQINKLSHELKAVESLHASMVEKLNHSKSTLATHIKNLDSSNMPSKDKAKSIAYYENEVRLNELDIQNYEERINAIKEELRSLGVSV